MSEPIDPLQAAVSDRYTVERKLGAGGMATVYLAQDVRHNRKVAIKVMDPDLAELIGAPRFLKEIETTASLQHPNILPLYDSGRVGTTVFYVMPYVQGESLRARLTRETQLARRAPGQSPAVNQPLSASGRAMVTHRLIASPWRRPRSRSAP